MFIDIDVDIDVEQMNKHRTDFIDSVMRTAIAAYEKNHGVPSPQEVLNIIIECAGDSYFMKIRNVVDDFSVKHILDLKDVDFRVDDDLATLLGLVTSTHPEFWSDIQERFDGVQI